MDYKEYIKSQVEKYVFKNIEWLPDIVCKTVVRYNIDDKDIITKLIIEEAELAFKKRMDYFKEHIDVENLIEQAKLHPNCFMPLTSQLEKINNKNKE